MFNLPIQIVSIFSGAGGFDLAFEANGAFETRIMVESESTFCDTLRENCERGFFKSATIVEDDIRSIDPATLIPDNAKNWGLIGGPPCQSFSSMGRRQSTRDHRGALVFEFVRWASHPAFSFFVFENVPDLEKIDKGSVIRELVTGFEAHGYGVAKGILCAADFGAATSRKRLVVVGWRNGIHSKLPIPTHAKNENLFSQNLLAWVTSGEVLRDLPDPWSENEDRLHLPVKHSEEVTRRFEETAPGSYDNVRKRSRLHPDRPSPSLVAGNLAGTRNHIHPIAPRELTNREIARIQGFPDEFAFCGKPAYVAKQITNAVPLQLGMAIADEVCKSYSSIGLDKKSVTGDQSMAS